MWDTSMVLPEASLLGRALHALFGYSDQPTALQFVVWAATLAATFGLMKMVAPRPRRPVAAE
jgi:high-affinity iron transporter